MIKLVKRILLFTATVLALGNTYAHASGLAVGFGGSSSGSDDVNVAKGIVAFKSVDLNLGGKNGLDLTIARNYNSQLYKSTQQANIRFGKLWGGFIGTGWSFNFAQRAFAVITSDNLGGVANSKIVLECNGGMQSYEFVTQNATADELYFKASARNNFSKATYFKTSSKIVITTTQGLTYEFAKKDYEEQHSVGLPEHTILIPKYIYFNDPHAGIDPVPVTVPSTYQSLFEVKGYYLTSIANRMGNTLTFSYETYTADETDPETQTYDNLSDISIDGKETTLTNVIGKTYRLLGTYFKEVQDGTKPEVMPYKVVPTNHHYRPNTITDTFGQTVSIGYDTGSNSASSYKQTTITKISYKNVNGDNEDIVYTYDLNNHLTSVKRGNLPAETYAYALYEPGFKLYEKSITTQVPEYQWDWNPFNFGWHLIGMTTVTLARLDSVEYSDSDFASGATVIDNMDEYKGYLLSKRVSKTQAVVSYTYGDNLQQMPKDVTAFITDQFRDIPNATYPIVLTKTVADEDTAPGTTYSFSYTYAQDSKGHPVMTPYFANDPYSDADLNNTQGFFETFFYSSNNINRSHMGYYFGSVTIDNPAEIKDETFTYHNGVNTRKTNGIFTTESAYNDNYLVSSVTTKVNDAVRSKVEYVYDGYNNITDTKIYKGSTLQKTVKSTYYSDSSFVDNNLVNLLKTRYVLKSGDVTHYQPVYFEYNTNGQITNSYKGDDTNNTLLTTYTYKTDGRPDKVQPAGQTGYTQFVYTESASERKIEKKYMAGSTMQYSSYTTMDPYTGNPKTVVDVNGNTTAYAYYDTLGIDNGMKKDETYPDGSKVTYAYSDLNTTTITSEGRSVTTKTDNFGRVIEIDNPANEQDLRYTYYFGSKVSAVEVAENGAYVEKQSKTYDDYLRVLTAVNSEWGTTSYAYNDTNRTVTITDPYNRQTVKTTDELGKLTNLTYSANNRSTSHTYDAFGHNTQTIDPRGLRHDAEFDTEGKLSKSFHTYSSNGTARKQSQMSYDAIGRLTGLTTYDATAANALYRTYTYTFDSFSRPSQILLGDTVKETFTYDQGTNGKGNLTAVTNEDTTLSYEYDSMGRVKKETTQILDAELARTYYVTTEYTKEGLVQKVIYQDGKYVYYTYDSNDRLNKIQYYNGSITREIASFSYLENGSVDYMTYGNQFKMDNTYNESKQVLIDSLAVKDAQDNIKYEIAYGYDPRGNITTASFPNLFQKQQTISKTFGFDASTDELTSTSYATAGQTQSYTYSYDNNGNTLSFGLPVNGGTTQTTHAIANEVDQVTKKTYPDGRYVDFEYDPEGNLKTKKRYNGSTLVDTFTYAYNYHGQLKQISSNAVNATFGYDHNRQRIWSKITANGKTAKKFYYWLGGNIIGEGNTSDPYIVRYIYAGNAKIAMVRNDEIFFFVNNGQGTPSVIMNWNGRIIHRQQQDDWGNLEKGVAGSENEINYTGKKLDATGLYYFNQRYYDPELGRFIQPDPAGQYYNPYLYAGNNPLKYVDPQGLYALADNFENAGKTFGFYAGLWDGISNGKSNMDILGTALQWSSIGGAYGKVVGTIAEQMIVSAVFAQAVGDILDKFEVMEDLWISTAAHGISGGIQSEMFGGKFGQGFAGGAIGNLTGHSVKKIDNDMLKIIAAGLGGGLGSWAASGDFGNFGTGFIIGAGVEAFNHLGTHRMTMMDQGNTGGNPDTLYDKIVNRDDYNFEPDTLELAKQLGFKKLPWYKSLLHEPWKNTKWICSNGWEAVYCGNVLVDTGLSRGTFNIYSPNDMFRHTVFDIFPFFMENSSEGAKLMK